MTVVDEHDLCVDCGVDCIEIGEYYMVSDACWERAGMKPHGGFLCIGCLEERLGEKLKSVNFKECPLNWRNILLNPNSSTRLLSRMFSGGPKSKWKRLAIKCIEELESKKTYSLLSKLTLVSIDENGKLIDGIYYE